MAKLIGTAGHVDHGKTTLIRALTGIDADRLPEEKKRGMTIDIGFAYMDLPKVGRVSIVDVPGHEKFLSNMLVGALGMDVALLCVAADESVMPQTRDHLRILELLPVQNLVVALTRADLADSEMREYATEEVRELLEGTRFRAESIIPVSAHTGEGLEDLKQALQRVIVGTSNIDGSLPWYLPIDRVFTIKGHGCVVTGTMAQGTVKVGDRAMLEPGRWEVRVRSIQAHGDDALASEAGKRTALNLSGIKAEQVHRGMSLGAPGALFQTTTFDARLRWVTPAKHAMRVRVSIGAEEVIGKVFLNDERAELAQFRLEQMVAVALDQPLIVRRYSPPDLVAGGAVVVPQAKVRRRKEHLVVVQAADPGEAILDALGDNPNGLPTEEICRVLGKTPQSLGKVFEALVDSGRARGFAGLWFSLAGFETGRRRFIEALQIVHQQNPASATVPREKVVVASGLQWSGKPLDRIVSALAGEGLIEAFGTTLKERSFRVELVPRQRQLLDRILGALLAEPINVPNPRDIADIVGVPYQAVEEMIRVGMQAGEVVQLGDGVYYTPGQVEALKVRIRDMVGREPFGAGELRDRLGTSRKFLIPVLEHFDAVRFTTRMGDKRVVNLST